MSEEYVVVRANLAGVFFGKLSSGIGASTIVLTDARRIWSWEGALCCVTLAVNGVGSHGDECMVSPVATKIIIRSDDVVEISWCSPNGIKSLSDLPAWENA